jgi:hypothetical protein
MQDAIHLSFVWEDATTGVAYTIVKIGAAAGGADLSEAGTMGNGTLGVLQNTPLTGEMADVIVHGRSRLKAGGVIGLKARITATTAGVGIATTTTTEEIAAVAAFEASTAANDIIWVWVPGPGVAYP